MKVQWQVTSALARARPDGTRSWIMARRGPGDPARCPAAMWSRDDNGKALGQHLLLYAYFRFFDFRLVAGERLQAYKSAATVQPSDRTFDDFLLRVFIR
jgi:hypothetical protein